MMPKWILKKKELARKLYDKAPDPKYGVKINLGELSLKDQGYIDSLKDINEAPDDIKESLNELVFPYEKNKSGLILNVDKKTILKSLKISEEQVTIMEIEDAIQSFNWVKDYWFKAIPMSLNKLTLFHAMNGKGGYFVHVRENAKIKVPLEICFIVRSSRYAHLPHNILIAEPNSEIHILSGCTAPTLVSGSLHAGLTEIFIKKNAKVIHNMIEYWPKTVHARPLQGVIVEDGGEYIGNTIIMDPGASFQAYPTVILKGTRSTTVMHMIALGLRNTVTDIGEGAYLLGNNSSARLISRAIAMRSSKVIQRTKTVGIGKGSKAHTDCSGLILGDQASIKASPLLDGSTKYSELTHESAIGKISEDQLIYLMSRGFSEEEAISLIVRGFIDPGLEDLPALLKKQVESLVEIMVKRGSF